MGAGVEVFATVRFWAIVAAGLLGLSLLSIAKEALLRSIVLRLTLNIVHLYLIACVLVFWSWAVAVELRREESGILRGRGRSFRAGLGGLGGQVPRISFDI